MTKENQINHVLPAFSQDSRERPTTSISADPRVKWNEERIECEARLFFEEHGCLAYQDLRENGKSGLGAAVARWYPEKIFGLRRKLGIKSRWLKRSPRGYWTPERIESEARVFFENYGNLTRQLLSENGRDDLGTAITQRYPGRMSKIKRRLGISIDLIVANRRSPGSWTNDSIEEEAKLFFEEHGDLTYKALKKNKRNDLGKVIARKYPGKISQLKLALGIEKRNSKLQDISTEEANEQLRMLLGE